MAVTLFSAAGASTITDDGRSCELILLYDGDLSCIRMNLTSKSSEDKVPAFTQQPPPLERDIVSAWKNASNEAIEIKKKAMEDAVGIHNDAALQAKEIIEEAKVDSERSLSDAR